VREAAFVIWGRKRTSPDGEEARAIFKRHCMDEVIHQRHLRELAASKIEYDEKAKARYERRLAKNQKEREYFDLTAVSELRASCRSVSIRHILPTPVRYVQCFCFVVWSG